MVRVSDSNQKAVDGELSVLLDMPEHGHSSPKRPIISFDASARAFTLDPMDLFMVGLWRLTFSFTPYSSEGDGAAGAAGASASSAADAGDWVAFEFCVE